MVEVTQADERAAETIRRGIGGKYDREHQRNALAFARHRTASTAALTAERDALVARVDMVRHAIDEHENGEFYPGEPEHVVSTISGMLAARKAPHDPT